MALNTFVQDDFSQGIVRAVEGQRIPRNGVYDCVNGLLDDDLGIYRRGGGAYKSNADAGDQVIDLWDGYLAAGARTFFATGGSTFILDASDDATPRQIGGTSANGIGRPVEVDGVLCLTTDPPGGASTGVYAGSLKTGTFVYTTGTVTVTAESKTVTGAGTAWLANADAGIIFNSGGRYAVVQSVDSNTQLTLRDPWRGSTAAGAAYELAAQNAATMSFLTASEARYYGTAGGRLLVGQGNRVWISDRGEPLYFPLPNENFHALAEGVRVLGIEGVGDDALVFTTGGIWAVTNLAYDLTDDYGNPQQQTRQLSKDVVLWGDQGLAGWRSGVVVPALDDVYLTDMAGGTVPISEPIRPLYRGYVKAGYTPGIAATFRGHYFLPILNGTTWVDTLVCRLDGERPAWTRWSGFAAGRSVAARVSTSTGPKLLSVSGERVTDLTDCFVPSSANKNDADGTTHVLTVVTRDFFLRPQVRNLWRYLRARFQLDDAGTDNPTLTVESSAGPPETEVWVSSGSVAEGTGEDSSKVAILNSDGNPGRREQSIRFRIRSSGPTARLVLRSLEVFFRPSGRQ